MSFIKKLLDIKIFSLAFVFAFLLGSLVFRSTSPITAAANNGYIRFDSLSPLLGNGPFTATGGWDPQGLNCTNFWIELHKNGSTNPSGLVPGSSATLLTTINPAPCDAEEHNHPGQNPPPGDLPWSGTFTPNPTLNNQFVCALLLHVKPQGADLQGSTCFGQAINPPLTPIGCQLSDWSACSVSCGGGTETRTVIQQPQNGGQACGDLTQSCNTQACEVSQSAPAPQSPQGPPGPPQCTAQKPPKPQTLSAEKTSPTTVKLTWSAVIPVTYYAISYGTDPNNLQFGVPNVGNSTSFVVGALNPNLKYYFKVIAVNDCMPSDPTAEVSPGGVLGASTEKVLGASTDRLAATGSNLYLPRIMAAAVFFVLSLTSGVKFLHGSKKS